MGRAPLIDRVDLGPWGAVVWRTRGTPTVAVAGTAADDSLEGRLLEVSTAAPVLRLAALRVPGFESDATLPSAALETVAIISLVVAVACGTLGAPHPAAVVLACVGAAAGALMLSMVIARNRVWHPGGGTPVAQDSGLARAIRLYEASPVELQSRVLGPLSFALAATNRDHRQRELLGEILDPMVAAWYAAGDQASVATALELLAHDPPHTRAGIDEALFQLARVTEVGRQLRDAEATP